MRDVTEQKTQALQVGLTVLFISVILLVINPSSATGLKSGFATPIIALEFAETEAEAEALFPSGDVVARDMLASQFLLGNKIDYVFMVAYGAFLFFFSQYLARSSDNRLYLGASALAVLAPLADMVENLQIAKILKSVAGENEPLLQSTINLMHTATWIKWLALALVFLIFAYHFYTSQKRSWLMAILLTLPVLLAIAAWFQPGAATELFAKSIALNFVALIIRLWRSNRSEPSSA